MLQAIRKRFAKTPPSSPHASNAMLLRADWLTQVQGMISGAAAFGYSEGQLADLYAASVTAYACTNVRANIISSIPVLCNVNGSVNAINPAQQFLANANQLLWNMSAYADIWGNWYLRKRYNAYGLPSEVELLHPMDVTPIVQRNPRSNANEVTAYRLATGEQVPAKQIVAYTEFNPFSDIDGLSKFEVALKYVSASDQMITWAGAFFTNSARPDGLLIYKGGNLPKDQREAYKTQWQQEFKGSSNAWKTMYAEGGEWEWVPITTNMADLALTELDDSIQLKICVAFDVNGALIGVASVSDRLSAQSTFRAIQDQHTEQVAVPRMRRWLDLLNAQWLSEFTQLGHVELVIDAETINARLLVDTERSSIAGDNLQKGIFTNEEARRFLGRTPLVNAIERNPEWPTQLYLNGLIRFNEARAALGLPPDPQINGFVYELDPRQAGAQQPTFGWPFTVNGNSVSESPQIAATGSPTVTDSAVVAPTATANVNTPTAMTAPRSEPPLVSIVLPLPHNEHVRLAFNTLREAFPTIEYQDPASWHMTLMVGTGEPAAVEQLRAMVNAKSWAVHAVAKAAHIRTWESDNGRWVTAVVYEPNEALANLKMAAGLMFFKAGITPLDHYAADAEWLCHTTIAYSDTDPFKDATPHFAAFWVHPHELSLSTKVGETWQPKVTRPLTQRAYNPTTAIDELRKWQGKVKKFGPTVAFQTYHTPDFITEFVRHELTELWNPKLVFRAAREWLSKGIEPQPFGATPEEVEAYWSAFDELSNTVGDEWLSYMQQASGDVYGRAVDAFNTGLQEISLDDVLKDHARRFVANLTGSEANAGILAQMLGAGMANANDMLNRLAPKRAIVGDWALVMQEAVDIARSMSLELIQQVDKTTQNEIRRVLVKAIQEGWTLDEFTAALERIVPRLEGQLDDEVRNRARLIAEDLSAKAYNEGAFVRYKQVGVVEGTFQTVRDSHVCPVCRPLHGVTFSLVRGVPSKDGTYKRPPLHNKCKCFFRPVLPSEYLAGTSGNL